MTRGQDVLGQAGQGPASSASNSTWETAVNFSIDRFRRNLLAAVAVLFMAPVAARAGEINDLDGAAIKGYDPVAYFTQGKPVPGSEQFVLRHKGATFRFASAANRDAFAAAPERYAPQYGGFCAYGTSRGYKADIDPAAYTVVDGKLYLNYSKSVQTTWNQDRAGYIAKADANWPSVVPQEKVVR
jgi:YHS domain-containing protein